MLPPTISVRFFILSIPFLAFYFFGAQHVCERLGRANGNAKSSEKLAYGVIGLGVVFLALVLGQLRALQFDESAFGSIFAWACGHGMPGVLVARSVVGIYSALRMRREHPVRVRKPTADERRLIDSLSRKAGLKLPTGWTDALEVAEIDSSGMGSLQLISSTAISDQIPHGSKAPEMIFKDADGIEVRALLNLDSRGIPIELEMWKMDESPLVKIPDLM